MSRREKPIVILLGHKAQTGKDTLASFFVKRHGFKRYAFADKLKDVVADLYGFTQNQMYGDEKEIQDERYVNNYDEEKLLLPFGQVVCAWQPNPIYRPHLTPRRILQIFGQQQRALYPDIWAAYVYRCIQKDIDSGHTRFVIADFRFPNEYNVALKDFGFQTALHSACGPLLLPVKIERQIDKEISGNTDISETALNDFKLWNETILNNRSKAELFNHGFEILKKYHDLDI